MIKIWVLISMYSMHDIHKVNTKSLCRVYLFTRVTVPCNLLIFRAYPLAWFKTWHFMRNVWMNELETNFWFMPVHTPTKSRYTGFMLQIHHRIKTTPKGFLIAGETIPLSYGPPFCNFKYMSSGTSITCSNEEQQHEYRSAMYPNTSTWTFSMWTTNCTQIIYFVFSCD